MIDEIIERPIVDSNIVRVTLPDGDVLWLDRKDITRFENMGITVMRDELMGSLFVDETNIERYFAEFMSQHEKKQWQYFNVRYGTEQFSFHVAREKENDLIQYIMEQSSVFSPAILIPEKPLLSVGLHSTSIDSFPDSREPNGKTADMLFTI